MSVPFHKDVCAELLQEDGLSVLGRGLGIHSIVMRFIKLYCSKKHLVFVLNVPYERQLQIRSELQVEGVSKLPSIIVETTSEERAKIYKQGGVVFVSSTVLALDLLKKNLRTHIIAGFLVTEAHRVIDGTQEHFILTLYRQTNTVGFIKAFTEIVPRLTGSYNKIENIMSSLYVKQLYLWPRFHSKVSESLEKRAPEVIELHISLSPSMKQIQASIIEILKVCLNDLKATNQLDMTELTLENGFFRHFDELIRMQLDPIWLSIDAKTKQLVSDLRSLRILCTHLLSKDCIGFNKSLEWMKVNELGEHSDWIYHPAASELFSVAKARILRQNTKQPAKKKRNSEGNEEPATSKKYSLILEENPKWITLRKVLDEIFEKADGNTKILVMARDIPTCRILNEYLQKGGREFLEERWNQYINRKSYLKKNKWYGKKPRTFKKTKDKGKFTGRRRRNDPTQKSIVDMFKNSTKKEKSQEKSEEVSEEASEDVSESISESVSEEVSTEVSSQVLSEISDELSEDVSISEEISEDISTKEESKEEVISSTPDTIIIDDGDDDSGEEKKEELEEIKVVPVKMNCFEVIDVPQVVIQPYGNLTVLEDISPQYVVLYNPEVSFIRQLEVYQYCKPKPKLKVYFLLYEDSVEEQQYLSTLNKENQSFESLIRSREKLVIPEPIHLSRNDETEESEISTRAGGKFSIQTKKKSKTILVDTREFRSKLPSSLFYKGFDIVPITLEVGDYILSPNICIERKSISDLFSSFQSGRLYTQTEAMCKQYNTPILLIEFDAAKSFALINRDSIDTDIQNSSIISKLVLLTIHFPKLLILWSRDARVTGTLFEDLKNGEDEPVSEDKEFDALTDTDPIEFLRRLPGITPYNIHKVINSVENLHELSQMTKKKLTTLLGARNGEKLYSFFNTTYNK